MPNDKKDDEPQQRDEEKPNWDIVAPELDTVNESFDPKKKEDQEEYKRKE